MASKLAGDRWIGHMTWRDLLFAHWPVPASALRPHVPPRMEIDEFEGSAWIAVVPFEMTNIYVRGLPPIPGISRTLELNVRTYVRVDGTSGVYFFSLDAESWPAVIGARTIYHLNYLHARMSLDRDGEEIAYTSRRSHPGARTAEFRGIYWPTGAPYLSRNESLEYWLTERYCLFATDARGRMYRGDIDHERWPLQHAEAEFETNSMADLALPSDKPLLHFAKKLEVRVRWPQRV